MRVLGAVLALLLAACGVSALSIGISPKYADAMKYAIGACPCDDRNNCALIKGVRHEVHALSYGNDWKNFDMSALTMITVMGPNIDPELMCMSHSKGVRVLMRIRLDLSQVLAPEQRDEWINGQIDFVARNRVDGIHLEFDNGSLKMDGISTQLASVVQELKKRMFERMGSSRVVITLPSSPLAIDGHIHSLAPIAVAADLVFVAEDAHQQIVDRCVASHMGSYQRIRNGLVNYMDLSIPRAKLILGLSWRAYNFECENGTLPDASVCLIRTRNPAECPDNLAMRVDLDQILLANFTQTAQGFDSLTQSSYFNYVDGSSVRQVWYDTMDTLRAKYDIAAELGLAGVGVTSMLSRHPEIQSALLHSL